MADRTPSKKSRHPATSARILATGLSATAVLGLTSALALAKPENGGSTATTVTEASTPIGETILGSNLSTGSTASQPKSVANPQPTVAPAATPSTAAPVTQNTTAPATNSGKKQHSAPPVTQTAPPTTQAPVVVTVPAPPSNGGSTSTPSKSNGS